MLLLVAAGEQPMVGMMVVNFHLNLLLGQLDLVEMDELLFVVLMMMMINNHLLVLLMMELGGIVWKKFVVAVVVSVLVKHSNMLVKFLMKTLNFY